jgi:DNA-binding transcriptional LysR family regulator/DNA-binding XRE family transcriptional regulator
MPNRHNSAPHVDALSAGETVRRRLRALRVAKGMSQAELARRTNMATCTVNRLESGKCGLTIDYVGLLAAALEVDVGALTAGTANPMTIQRRAPAPPDLDLRRLRYFVALAEELHFGRAAESLEINQPVLSRQIQRLEEDLGVELLTRSSRRVELTSAGRQLFDEARALLSSANALGRRVRRAATAQATLRVGFLVGDPIIQLVRAFDDRHPAIDVDVERIYWSDQPGALLNDHHDVSFVHLPIDDDGLALAHVYSSQTVVLLPRDHRLAKQSEVSISQLTNDPVVQHWGASPIWEAAHNVDPRPDGSRPRRGPTVRNLEEKIEVVGTGRAIGFIPASVTAAIQIPPEVVAIPGVDIAPTEVSLAWKADRRSPAIRDLVATAQATLPARWPTPPPASE